MILFAIIYGEVGKKRIQSSILESVIVIQASHHILDLGRLNHHP